MAVLSVDLAYKSYADLGVVLLSQVEDKIRCEPIRLQRTGDPCPPVLATILNDICSRNEVRCLLLDGPQGWKAKDNGLAHSRICERALNTPAKTGEPFEVKPTNYAKFARFSVEVFDALCKLNWARVADREPAFESSSRWLIESFPLAAWKQLKLLPLPSKRKCRDKVLSACLEGLAELFPLELTAPMTHDEVQATVAGLAGLALESGQWNSCKWAGEPARLIEGHWREGLIANRMWP